MSYILEALKKAQAERQLGGAPTIHAPPLVAPVAPGPAASRRPLLVGLGAGALVVAIAALVAWRQQAPAPANAPLVAAAPPAAVSAPPASHPAPAASGRVSIHAHADAGDSQTLRVGGKPAHPTAYAPDQNEAIDHPPEPAARAAPAIRVTPASPAVPDSAAKPAAAEPVPRSVPDAPPPVLTTQQGEAEPAAYAAVRGLQALPEVIQREVPKVVFGGYIYSQNPADRLLLIDKALRREGEEVAPGLMLERLLPKAAIMNYRGYRYRVPY